MSDNDDILDAKQIHDEAFKKSHYALWASMADDKVTELVDFDHNLLYVDVDERWKE